MSTRLPEKEISSIFGNQDTRRGANGKGQGSRLSFTPGAIHDKANKPVIGLHDRRKIDGDPVLENAIRPTLRDHARHNESGVVADKGKFDELVVCTGHRFTFEIELTGWAADSAAWDAITSLLTSSSLRFGGKTTRGLGKFRAIETRTKVFDLSVSTEMEAYAAHPADWSEPLGGEWINVPPSKAQGLFITLDLKPDGFWMFGGGVDPDVDMVPVRDRRVKWEGTGGSPKIEGFFSLPGSALKGALRHHAVFLASARKGYFAGDSGPEAESRKADALNLVTGLFGSEPGDKSTDEKKKAMLQFTDGKFASEGRSNNGELDDNSRIQNHVSIDRFTGGARDSALFDEKPLYLGGPICWEIGLTRPLNSDEHALLEDLFQDLVTGHLPLGGGVGRGLGSFSGTHNFPQAT
jgi:CRISPR/Cas system CSM-associated protein Csm3 (group 7 of RAMP superfamily)